LEDSEKRNGPVFISRITVVEIPGGLKAKNANSQEAQFRDFLKTRTILEVNEAIGEQAAEIFAHLYKTGRHSGSYDILIAATAIANQLLLSTNNTKNYQHIPGLKLLNWRKEDKPT
jgi:tRNA(fMet)-specific endonuclease VapC